MSQLYDLEGNPMTWGELNARVEAYYAAIAAGLPPASAVYWANRDYAGAYVADRERSVDERRVTPITLPLRLKRA